MQRNNLDHNSNQKGVFNETPFFCLFVLGLLLWAFAFRHYLSGAKGLQMDATAYFGHVMFYLDQISRGVFPFWDPTRDLGTANEFYLRRIGEFNPFYWLIILFKTLGVSEAVSYRLFLGFYFMLCATGFYALARRILGAGLPAFTAALLFLFSSVGTLSFHSYLLLTLTPMIWFFYFAATFLQQPRRFAMLGSTFCLMIIAITYIPFYFLTVLLVIGIAWGIAYFHTFKGIAERVIQFIRSNSIFTLLCTALFLVSLIPGWLWHMEAARGEALSVVRHVESPLENTATINIARVNEGGIILSDLVRHIFADLNKLPLGEFFIPVLMILILLTGVWTKFSRPLIVFAISFISIFIIAMADASPVHKFLYTHVFFFKYFRNLHFFLWLAALPLAILFAAEILRLLTTEPLNKKTRVCLASFAVACHVGVAVLFFLQEGSILSTYISILVSLLFFLSLIFGWIKPQSWRAASLILLACMIQPVEVYAHADRLSPNQQSTYTPYNRNLLKVNLPDKQPLSLAERDSNPPNYPFRSYFGVKWIFPVLETVRPAALISYVETPLFLYDKVEPLKDDKNGYGNLEGSFSVLQNIAYVSQSQIVDIQKTNGQSNAKAQAVIKNGSVEILKNDVNTLHLRTNLIHDKFLVWNNAYYSKWKAFIDGKQVPLYRTNGAFQGLWIPAGGHKVIIRYGETWRYALSYMLLALFWGIFIYLIRLTVKRI